MAFSTLSTRVLHAKHACTLSAKSIPLLLVCLLGACAGATPQPVSTVKVIPKAPSQVAGSTYQSPGDYKQTALSLQNGAGSAADTPDETHGWLASIDADFAFAKTLVEEELQVDLGDTQLQVVDDAPINLEVARETQRLVVSQFGHTAFAKEFLGQIMGPLAGTYAALYSGRLNTVMISRSMLESYEASIADDQPAATKHAALLTLLIHELVHAADEKRFHINDNRALNFRASFAQSATFEGHAQWVTRNICETAGCSEGLKALDTFMFATDLRGPAADQSVQAVSRNVLEYSYVEGERFVEALAARENGAALIDQALSLPPQDPLQILAPDTYPDVAREARNQRLISASRAIDHAWQKTPWASVETSPLKGVDMRSDKIRRQAAIDGFTKLIKAMVSMQYYDQQQSGDSPMEATILEAESANTAVLFANMLHTNTQHLDARVNDEPLSIHTTGAPADVMTPVHIYRTAIDGDINYRTTVAVSDNYVVQISGKTGDQKLLDDYAIRVLLELTAGPAT